MSLRAIAEQDNKMILGDTEYGFAWDIIVTDPAETSASVTGLSGDIGQMIDPDTGQAVTGRFAHVSINISLLADNGLDIPRGISRASSKPWVIEFDDLYGESYKFKVSRHAPDRTMGMVTCILEQYE